jgi:hypothetical protein
LQSIRRAACKEIRKLKAGNVGSKFIEQENLENWKFTKKFQIQTLQVS